MSSDIDNTCSADHGKSFPVTIVLLVIALVAFAGVCHPLFSLAVYGGPDLSQQDYPSRAFYAAGLHNGELRFWSPHLFRGFSLLGEGQTGVCHPLHLILYRFLPFPVAAAIDTVWVFPFAFAGMFLFSKRMGMQNRGALLAANLFSFSTFFYSHAGHLSLLAVHAHLPWILFFVDRLCKRPDHWELSVSGLALATGSAALLGHPPQFWSVLLATGIYTLSCQFRAGRSPRPSSSLGPIAAGLILGLFLGAVQLVSTLILVQQSARGSLSAVMRYDFSLHPLNLLQFASPYIFRNLAAGNWIRGMAAGPGTYVENISEFAVYPGMIAMILVMVALRRKDGLVTAEFRPRIRAIVLLMGVGLLLMLGRYGILFPLMGTLPFVREFRCAARYISYVQFGVAILAGLGLEDLLGKDFRRPPRMIWFVPLISAGVLLVAVPLLHVCSPPRPPLASSTRILSGPLLAVLGCLLVHASRARRSAAVLLAVAAVADLSIYGMHILVPIEKLPMHELQKLSAAYETPPEINREYRLEAPANSGIWNAFLLSNGYCGIPPREPLENYVAAPLRYRLSSTARVWEDGAWLDVPSPLPRFRLVPKLAHDTEENRVRELSEWALVSDPTLILPELPGIAAGSLVVQSDTPHQIAIRAECPVANVLVCSDRYDSDWRASIEGTEVPILPLYGWSMRGILLPAGISNVVMSYRPTSVYRAAAVSGLALLVIVLTASVGFYRSGRTGAEDSSGRDGLEAAPAPELSSE